MAYLAYAATLLVAILVEREHALGTHEVHGLLCIWKGVLDANAVVLLNTTKQLVRLLVQPSRVQAAQHEPDVQI